MNKYVFDNIKPYLRYTQVTTNMRIKTPIANVTKRAIVAASEVGNG